MGSYKNRRREGRSIFITTLEYTTEGERDVEMGITLNSSSQGLCLLVFKPISRNQKVVIQHKKTSLSIRGMVKWIKRYGSDIYKIGISTI